MKTAVLLAALLLPGIANPGQQHAPTADQCDADRRLWVSQWSNVSSLPYHEVEAREAEMTACSNIMDSSTEAGFLKAKLYETTSSSYRAEMGARLQSFLARHNLIEQFQSEDAAGKR
jgi:hypothetical protein